MLEFEAIMFGTKMSTFRSTIMPAFSVSKNNESKPITNKKQRAVSMIVQDRCEVRLDCTASHPRK
jgi:hypothetical protein